MSAFFSPGTAAPYYQLPSFITFDEVNKVLYVTGGISGGLSVVGSGMGGGGVIKMTASDPTEYSACDFFDVATGIEHGAIGWGNQSGSTLNNISFWELSDLGSGNTAPLNGGIICQTSFHTAGIGSYSWVPRITFTADLGPLILTGYDSNHNATALTIDANKIACGGLFYPQQAPTASAPSYVKGGVYFDTTLSKLRVGGASAWETVTSI